MSEQDETLVESVMANSNGAEIILHNKMFMTIATELAKMLKEFDAPNYITTTMNDGEESFEVTVRRGYGKTPAEKIHELESELASVKATAVEFAEALEKIFRYYPKSADDVSNEPMTLKLIAKQALARYDKERG